MDFQPVLMSMVIDLEIRKGHLKWSVSQLAQASKVSRSLVYYYFGKSKKEILINCLQGLAENFYGLAGDRVSYNKIPLEESLLMTHQEYRKNTNYAVFYQKWRHIPGAIQDVYLEIEKRYEKKLKANFPRATLQEIRGLHAIFHGLVTAPYLNDESLRQAVRLLKLEALTGK